jgi:sortase A
VTSAAEPHRADSARSGPAVDRLRRLVRSASTVLILVGVLLLADAGLTLVWQEPVSAFYAKLSQQALRADLERQSAMTLDDADRRALRQLTTNPLKLAYLARRHDRRMAAGDAYGRIRIPEISADFVMVEGTDATSLRKGPGHYPQTSSPGERGTVAIAGHRTTFQAPFRRIDELERGDVIDVSMPYGQFTYAVERTRIVPPSALWVTRRVSYDRVVLTACHPLYSAAQRIVVFARLVKAAPSPQR